MLTTQRKFLETPVGICAQAGIDPEANLVAAWDWRGATAAARLKDKRYANSAGTLYGSHTTMVDGSLEFDRDNETENDARMDAGALPDIAYNQDWSAVTWVRLDSINTGTVHYPLSRFASFGDNYAWTLQARLDSDTNGYQRWWLLTSLDGANASGNNISIQSTLTTTLGGQMMTITYQGSDATPMLTLAKNNATSIDLELPGRLYNSSANVAIGNSIVGVSDRTFPGGVQFVAFVKGILTTTQRNNLYTILSARYAS